MKQKFILFVLAVAAVYFSTWAKDHPLSKRMKEARVKVEQTRR